LFAGWRDARLPPEQGYDWWVTPIEGGQPVKTGAADVLRRAGLSNFAVPGNWTGNRVIFSGSLGDSTDLWRVEISPKSWQITGSATRLTTGTSSATEASPASDETRVYAILAGNAEIWE